ncbi:neurofilament heavy polypeptide-like [Actinia tenebrosa]|uniref:Neurofilament heavy polypeptide-like n=1 Tax=Actinia tenebrosa TaxID=6105 RepID=A0A6P8HI19_ACTTE|nr:neurofilament heavy polypeptide-like [Actinia tenebrosa]
MPGKKGATKAAPKVDSQPEKTPEVHEEKAPEAEVEKEEPTVENVEERKNPEKKGRGRPKKTDSSEPSTKKPKQVKERNPPSRVSRRVANMKSGVTEPAVNAEQEPKNKDVSSKKAQAKAQEGKKELSASNGATEQAVES